MDLKIFNTLKRQKESFVSIIPQLVTIYICGVTVYDESHIGHLRPAVVFDAISRVFTRYGVESKIVVNFTDIDDKIILRSQRENRTWQDISEEFIGKYLRDIKPFGFKDIYARPKASEHIKDIEEMIFTLEKRGIAYQDKSGSVWFHVPAFKKYGKLSNRTLDKLENAEHKQGSEGEKKSPLDFCLWKIAKEGEPFFESRYGRGRPGWHIECSAMIKALLGETIDIHAGGLDLVFPHHENEIAQSEASCDKNLANYWMHIGLVTLKGEKMAKSLGNVKSIKDLGEKYSRNSLRYFFHSTHYRSPLEFSEEKMEAGNKAISRIFSTFQMLQNLVEITPLSSVETLLLSDSGFSGSAVLEEEFGKALLDDFNFPKLLGLLFQKIKAYGSRLAKIEVLSCEDHTHLKDFLDLCVSHFELLGFEMNEVHMAIDGGHASDKQDVAPLLELLIEVRQMARKEKNFQLGDHIRDRLKKMGYLLEDGKDGTSWSVQK